MNRIIKYIIPVMLVFSYQACDKGIEPKAVTEPTGFSGTITFIGEWPAGIKRTHIVLFKNPLNDESDFNVFNLKYVSLEIPNGTETYQYNTTESAVLPESGYLDAGEYSYLAVGQSETQELSLNRADWFVAGLYFTAGDSTQPGKVIISEGVVLENVNIICNFDNPPPQPPGGAQINF
jgi:hypothetical protein